jgi:hypothetical protein
LLILLVTGIAAAGNVAGIAAAGNTELADFLAPAPDYPAIASII